MKNFVRQIRQWTEQAMGSSATSQGRRLIVSGTSMVLAVNVSSAGLAYLVQILLTRMLGKVEFGRFLFVVTIVNFLLIPAVAGLDVVLTRFLATYEKQQSWDPLRGLLRLALLGTLACSLPVALIAWLVTTSWPQLLPEAVRPIFWIGLITLPIMAVSKVRQGALRGFRCAALSVLPEGVIKPLLLGMLVLVGVFVFQIPTSTHAFLGFNLLAAFVVMVIGSVLLATVVKRRCPAGPAEYDRGAWGPLASSSAVMAGALLVMDQADILLLGQLVSTDLSGVYGPASRMALLVVFGINAVNTAFAPLVAQAASDRRQMQKFSTLASRLSLCIGLPFAVILWIFAEPILAWYGPEFVAGATVLRILATAQLVNVLCGSVGLLMKMSGHHRAHMWILISGALLDLLLNIWLIPRYEMVGAAIATGTCIVYWNLASLVYIRFKIGVDPTALGAR